MNITKEQIVREVSLKSGISREEIKTVIDTTLDVIKSNLKAGNAIFLRGFGCFSRVLRKGRIGRDIGRGRPIELPPHYATKFKSYFDKDDPGRSL